MTTKIRVRNFQSIQKGGVEVKGLTAITGPNNIGKSALLRAVRGVFQNTRGTSYVRHGADKCEVEIDFGDRKVLWEKGPRTKPTYYLDDGKPIHPGQGVPDEVVALGVHPISAGGREVWPQVAAQLSGQVFLLDEPGSVLAEAVANVDRVGRLNRCLKASESDKRSVTAELKVRRADKKALEEDLSRFDGLDTSVKQVEALEEKCSLASRVQKALVGVGDLRDRYARAQGVVDSLSGIGTVSIPDSEQVVGLHRELESLEDLRRKMTLSSERVDHLSGIENVGIPDCSLLVDLSDQLRGLYPLREKLSSVSRTVDNLSGVEDADCSVDLGNARKTHLALDLVGSLKERHRHWESTIRSLEKELASKASELEQVRDEVSQILGDMGECPLCGSSVVNEGE